MSQVYSTTGLFVKTQLKFVFLANTDVKFIPMNTSINENIYRIRIKCNLLLQTPDQKLTSFCGVVKCGLVEK